MLTILIQSMTLVSFFHFILKSPDNFDIVNRLSKFYIIRTRPSPFIIHRMKKFEFDDLKIKILQKRHLMDIRATNCK